MPPRVRLCCGDPRVGLRRSPWTDPFVSVPAVEDVSHQARLEVELAQAQFERELAERTRRLADRELAGLQAKVSDLRAQRDGLRRELAERDRLIGIIFSSKSWRFLQNVRRWFGRS